MTALPVFFAYGMQAGNPGVKRPVLLVKEGTKRAHVIPTSGMGVTVHKIPLADVDRAVPPSVGPGLNIKKHVEARAERWGCTIEAARHLQALGFQVNAREN